MADARPAAYAPDQVIVRFDRATTLATAHKALDGVAFTVAEAVVPSLDIYVVKLNGALQATDGVRMLKGYPHVRWAQLDHVVEERSTTPNDPSFGSQWSLNQASDADIDAPEAWDLTQGGTDAGGNDIVVAIVDNGCFLSHLDLAPNIWVNSGEIPDNSIDDDGNGYIDDVNGWNAYNINGTIPAPGSPYHGTHVAGIVGAVGNNSRQVCGVNWQVKLMIVAGSSTQTSVVARSYNYVLTQKLRWLASGGTTGANVVATNSSFGVNFGNCLSDSFPIWNELYNAMGAQGILSACATANIALNVDVSGDVPTGCLSPYIVSVTNSNSADQKHGSAAWGQTTIDLGAPGTSILSTINTGTGTLTGTSMATPHVSGAIALMHAAASPAFYLYYREHPDSAALAIKQMLLANVDLLPGWDTLTVSGGRLNLFNAVSAIHAYVGAQQAQPFLVYANQSVGDTVLGNGNGALEGGETASFTVTVANYGAAAGNVWGTLTTTDPYVTVLDSLGEFGLIPADSARANTIDPFQIHADSTAPVEHLAQFALTLTADSGYSTVQYFSVQIGQTVIYWGDNMESGEGEWTHNAVTTNRGDTWHLSTMMSSSPAYSWKCGDTGTAPYGAMLDAGLVSGTVAITPGSSLYFTHWMDAELSGIYPDSALDGGVVEISANGGPFDAVTPVGGYSKAFRHTRNGISGGPLAGRPCFSGVINWVQRQVDLGAYAGDSIRVRFRFSSDSAGAAHEGWYVDDVFVRGVAPAEPPLDSLSDVVIVSLGDDIELHWTTPPSGASRYVIFRNTVSDFEPTAADSIGWTTDTTFLDVGAGLSHTQGFYLVKAARP